MQASNTKPHILIAGAGIGGLVLAQCLRAQNHPFTIFDRDTSAHSRSQGWAIGLHSVLADLMASLPDDMPSIDVANHLLPFKDLPAQISFYDGRAADPLGARYVAQSKSADEVGFGPGRVIRANRDRLRDWLLTNLDVQWGQQVIGFKQDDDGVTVDFADGSTAKGEYLVGAEGVNSAVREGLIKDIHPQKVNECFVTGDVTLSKGQYERQLKLANSAYVVAGSGWFLFAGLNKVAEDASSADYYWGMIWADEARAAAGPHWIDSASPQELYDEVMRKIVDISEPRLTELVRLTDVQGMKTPPLILKDLVLEKIPVSRVTLLGDAAHAMVPFLGEGGCHAIDDAVKLAKTLTTGGSLDEYQKEMLRRAGAAVKASRAAGNQQDGSRNSERKAWGQIVKPVPLKV